MEVARRPEELIDVVRRPRGGAAPAAAPPGDGGALASQGRAVIEYQQVDASGGDTGDVDSMPEFLAKFRQRYLPLKKKNAENWFAMLKTVDQDARALDVEKQYRYAGAPVVKYIVSRPPFETMFLMERGDDERVGIFDIGQVRYMEKCGFVQKHVVYYDKGARLPFEPPPERRSRGSAMEVDEILLLPTSETTVCRQVPGFKTKRNLLMIFENVFEQDYGDGTKKLCTPLALCKANGGDRKAAWEEVMKNDPARKKLAENNEGTYQQRMKQYVGACRLSEYQAMDLDEKIHNTTLLHDASKFKTAAGANFETWYAEMRKVHRERTASPPAVPGELITD